MTRLAELAEHVLAPLVLGGPLRPRRPFGPRLALSIGEEARVPDSDLATRIDLARVRQARRLVPVDTVPTVGRDEFTLSAILNDVLVASHHELEGVFSRGRSERLLRGARDALARVPVAATPSDVLARHATFARVLEVVRVDRTVHSWAGRESFRGTPPPGRALMWKGVRRVRVEERSIGVADLMSDVGPTRVTEYLDRLGRWLEASPLTDLATAHRSAPAFRWSTATFSLLVDPTAAQMAERAARLSRPRENADAYLEAAKELSPGQADVVKRFVEWVG